MKRLANRGRIGTWVLACMAAVLLCVSLAQAQSAGTGAIAGTVTDPSGAAVAKAKVTLTSLATNQTRTTTAGANGEYRFSLLPPGTYKLDFTAMGFKTSNVPSVTVTTTETATVNQVLEIGSVTQTVTVETNAQVLQTESATLGSTVSGAQINALPMANGNYTEILSLAPGTSAPVDNATAIGKGTQDISANGVDPGSNNFMMDGVAVDNIANSGSANDGTIYTGIPIPSTDAIQEFKVQTTAYDASYGRNPGAIVNVTTRSGTNKFHGTAFEFFRNTVLNANDFFLKESQSAQGINKRPVFDQNQFGGTLGGPIKRDKLFFFFSYRGTRSRNAEAPQGQTFGALLGPALNEFPNAANPDSSTPGSEGRGTCPSPAALPDTLTVSSCDAQAQAFATAMGIANNNIVGLRLFQLTTGTAKNPSAAGVPNNYYIPSPMSYPQFCDVAAGTCNFNIPAIYTENQYVANGDWNITGKETLAMKYFYSHNPYTTYLGQGGGDLPGTPENILFGNHAAVLKLTSLVSSNFVNEATVSFQQNVNAATVAVPPGGCPNADTLPAPYGCGSPGQLGMKPLDPNFYEPFSTINVATGYGMFGGLLPDKGPTNQLEVSDQISWQHGAHSIRAGFSNQWTNWPLTDQGLQQGLMLIFGYSSFLGTGTNTGGPPWNLGCLFCVKGTTPTGNTGNITHFYQNDNRDAYIQDDWKVSSRLTINMGLRWEFDGLLTDKYGHLTQVWLNRMVANQDLPTSALAATTSSLGIQQYSVPSNFAAHLGTPPAGVGIASNRYNIQGHAPYSNFAPRFGFAWQPLSGGKLVVRGGVGIFYDRVGLDRVVHAFEQGYPYAATYDFGFLSPRWAASTLADPYPQIQLVCMPSNPTCNTPGTLGQGFAAAWFDPTTGASSGLNTPYDPVTVHTPLVRSYSLGIQYEFEPRWMLDVGYVGSSGINLTDYGHNHNGAQLITPSNDPYGICSGGTCNTAANVQYRVPYVGYEPIGLQASDFNGISNYNSLQVSVQHQFSHGLSLQAAYTWQKTLSDVFIGNSADINNALCMMCQYGRVNFDRPQRLSVNYSYDLPFGKGMQGFAGKAISGWTVSGVTIAQSGDPLTFIDPGAGTAYGTNTGIAFQGVGTAQYCAGSGNGNALASGSVLSRVVNGQYFNKAAFCPAPTLAAGAPFYGDGSVTTWGNSGVGAVLGPGQFNWDISLAKNTQITELVRVQFRADFYNAFNHPQFADPGAGAFGTVGFENITATNFGQISHMSVSPRLIQFGLHFFF
ncbi:MAG TPA: carboxypeptidase-like regulatory domain-containing protein [Candidatus Dormibacteraeota bacterium]|nr:carboxypeptidase-like regulatory domain-containing protein [Candidatus Dormibacteraeota bacterium]